MPAVISDGRRGGVCWKARVAAVDGGLRRLDGGLVWTHFIITGLMPSYLAFGVVCILAFFYFLFTLGEILINF